MDESAKALEGALRKSFAVIQQLKQQLADADGRSAEPIAVVGLSCRFPGGADSPEAYWKNLAAGVDARREIPADRWPWQRFYDADPSVAGTHYVRHGSFLDRIDGFDPDFFGISQREADALDPQHRLLLEVSWEALERAGLAAEQLRHSQTGVYVGIGQNDYADRELVLLLGGAALLRAWRPRAQHGHRHRLLLVARCPPPRLPGAAERRVRAGAGGWGPPGDLA
jgi:hypothetical protein